MNEHIRKIKKAIEPFRQQIIDHPVYFAIDRIEDIQIFMQYHVFAVWDFMSLLKSLQNNVTCTAVPWFPKWSGDIRYLINEIVVVEESDDDPFGNKKSHFELYIDAMHQCGTDISQIKQFIAVLENTGNFNLAFTTADIPKEVRKFVDFTFRIIRSNKNYVQSAVFTFGREDLIPNMFFAIINHIDQNLLDDRFSMFKHYLQRHIKLDGDHHSHLGLEMTSKLCGTNEQYWQEAEQAVIQSLQQRIELWNGIHKQIVHVKALSQTLLNVD